MDNNVDHIDHSDFSEVLESALTREQLAPLESGCLRSSVLASAGSGKTRTLVYSIAGKLAAGVPPENIVAFTFTEKAAGELLSRVHHVVRSHFPEMDLTGLQIRTIHSFCLNLLQGEEEFYNFNTLDELHVDSLVSRTYDYLGIQEAYARPFPKGIEPFLKDLELYYNELVPLDAVPTKINKPIERITELLHLNRLLTFGDIIRNAVYLLLRKYPKGLLNLRCLFVDEFQDINPAQAKLILAMCNSRTRLMVVGDDLQCIYQWRGSDITRILSFCKDLPDAESYSLLNNFRSRPGIIELSNRVADGIKFKSEKKMVPIRKPSDTHEICAASFLTEFEQAERLADAVVHLHAKGIAYGEMAVLLRSVLSSGSPIVNALQSKGIPYECPILGRSDRFVSGFLAMLFDWLRKDTLEPKNEVEEEELAQVLSALHEEASRWSLSPPNRMRFLRSLGGWRGKLERRESVAYNVRKCLYEFLDDVGIRVTIGDRDLSAGISIGSQIIRSVEEIQRRRLSGLKRKSPVKIMNDIYFALRRYKDRFGESIPLRTSGDAIIVSTVHQAKGLEWPIVFLPTLRKGRFPVRPQGHGTSFPDEIAERYGTSEEDEKRLFYVAATRAQEKLFMFTYGDDHLKHSTFLQALPDSTLWLDHSAFEDPEHPVWFVGQREAKTGSEMIHIGLSDLLLFIDCPFQYGLRRVVGIQPSVGDELGYGRSLHEIIQRRIENERPWSESDVQKSVDEYVHLPYTSSSQEEKAKKSIRKRVHVLEVMGAFDGDGESELTVELLLSDGLVLGVIDGLSKTMEGLIVRDWKSNVHAELLPRYALQLQAYAIALQSKGHTVARAELVDVGLSHSKGKLCVIPISLDSTTLDDVRRRLETALSSLKRGEFKPKPSAEVCARCDVYWLCAHRSDKP